MKNLRHFFLKIILLAAVINAFLILMLYLIKIFYPVLGFNKANNPPSDWVVQSLEYKPCNFEINKKYINSAITPLSPRYLMIDLEEQLTPKINNFTYFTFSIKRLAELDKWGNSLKIEKNFSTVSELKNWWKNSLFNFGSWEAGFARYLILIEKQIDFFSHLDDKKSQPVNFVCLSRNLAVYQPVLDSIIYNAQKNFEEKTYLKQIADKVFDYLYQKIEERAFPFSTSTLHYSLNDLTKNKNYGIYDVLIDESDNPNEFKNILLNFNGKVFKNENFNNEKQQLFKNLKIDDNSSFLFLSLPKINILANQKWQIEKNEKNNIAKYSLQIPISKYGLEKSYHFTASYQTADLKILQVEEKFSDNSIQPVVILSEYLLPNKDNSKIHKLINFYSQPAASSAAVLLFSPKSLSDRDLSKYQIELAPQFSPEITLKKTSGINDKKTKSEFNSQSFFNKTIKIGLILVNLIFFFYLLQMLYKLRRTKIRQVLSKIKLINNFAASGLIKMRSVLLTAGIFGILTHFFLFQNSPDIFIIILSVLLLFAAYSFKQDARVFFTVGLIFLVLGSILLSFRASYFPAEKMVIMSYIVFIIGCAKGFLEHIQQRQKNT